MIIRVTMVGKLYSSEERIAVNEYVKEIDSNAYYSTTIGGDGIIEFKNTIKTIDDLRSIMKDMRKKFHIVWRNYMYTEGNSLWDSKYEHMIATVVWHDGFDYVKTPENVEDLTFGLDMIDLQAAEEFDDEDEEDVN